MLFNNFNKNILKWNLLIIGKNANSKKKALSHLKL